MRKPICEHYENPCFCKSYDRESDCAEKHSYSESGCCRKTSCGCESGHRKQAFCYESSCCEPCCGGPFFTFPNFFLPIPVPPDNGG